MKKEIIESDIKVFYLTADTFPVGVPAAYEKLHSLIEIGGERKYFGISWPNESGEIIYKAAAEELVVGEGARYGCESFIIKKGEFACIEIVDHMKDSMCIGNAFRELLARSDIDPRGYCLEWYKNFADVNVKCMVGLINSKK